MKKILCVCVCLTYPANAANQDLEICLLSQNAVYQFIDKQMGIFHYASKDNMHGFIDPGQVNFILNELRFKQYKIDWGFRRLINKVSINSMECIEYANQSVDLISNFIKTYATQFDITN